MKEGNCQIATKNKAVLYKFKLRVKYLLCQKQIKFLSIHFNCDYKQLSRSNNRLFQYMEDFFVMKIVERKSQVNFFTEFSQKYFKDTKD